MIYICSCGCHEDEYEKGEIVPLLDEDMFNSTLCWLCHDEQSDRAEEAEANALYIYDRETVSGSNF